MFRLATKLALRSTGVCRYILPQAHGACRVLSTTSARKRRITKPTYGTPYSEVTILEAEKRLSLRWEEWGLGEGAVSVSHMLAQVEPGIEGLGEDQIRKTKERVYDNILDFIEAQGYPTESDEVSNNVNTSDLVLLIILPILTAFKRETGRSLFLQREKKVIDSGAGSNQEFIAIDFIKVGTKKIAFMVGANGGVHSGPAKRECLLAEEDMGDDDDTDDGTDDDNGDDSGDDSGDDGGRLVYGFVTTGKRWQMIEYNGKDFTETLPFWVLFHGMGHDKEKWMKEHSIIVDCIHAVLRRRGFVATGLE